MLADFDGDCLKEISVLSCDYSGQAHIFKANGTELPGWPVVLPQRPPPLPVWVRFTMKVGAVSAAQLIGDEAPELIIANNSGTAVHTYSMNGTRLSSFDAGSDFCVVQNPVNGAPVGSSGAWTPHSFPVVADLDGDGTNEIISYSTNIACPISTYESTASRNIQIRNSAGIQLARFDLPALRDPTNQGSFLSPLIMDLTGDNQHEIVVADNNEGLFAYDRYGSLLPGWPISTISGLGINPFGPFSMLFSAPFPLSLDGTIPHKLGIAHISYDPMQSEPIFSNFEIYSAAGGAPIAAINQSSSSFTVPTYSVYAPVVSSLNQGNPAISYVNETGLVATDMTGALLPAFPKKVFWDGSPLVTNLDGLGGADLVMAVVQISSPDERKIMLYAWDTGSPLRTTSQVWPGVRRDAALSGVLPLIKPERTTTRASKQCS